MIRRGEAIRLRRSDPASPVLFQIEVILTEGYENSLPFFVKKDVKDGERC